MQFLSKKEKSKQNKTLLWSNKEKEMAYRTAYNFYHNDYIHKALYMFGVPLHFLK